MMEQDGVKVAIIGMGAPGRIVAEEIKKSHPHHTVMIVDDGLHPDTMEKLLREVGGEDVNQVRPIKIESFPIEMCYPLGQRLSGREERRARRKADRKKRKKKYGY